MKRQTLLLLVITISSTATLTAQIQKGDILLGATAGFNYWNSDQVSSSTSNTNLSPRIAFGIGQNSVLGLRAAVTYSTVKSETSIAKTTEMSIGTSLFWRKYMPIKKQLGWYVETNGGIYFGKNVNKNAVGDKYKTSSTRYVATVIPGLYYQALPKLLINVDFGGLGYSYSRNKYEGSPTSRTSNAYITLMSSFTFGVDFILGKKG